MGAVLRATPVPRPPGYAGQAGVGFVLRKKSPRDSGPAKSGR
jgi:hypothetical protein